MARRRKSRDVEAAAAILGLAGLVLAVVLVRAAARWAGRHEAATVLIAVGVLLVAVLVLALVVRAKRAAAARLALLAREIANTDGMSGRQFEEWMALLMRNTGFRSVTVSGGANDQGADIVARAPDGRRTIVQCKAYAVHRSVGSPAVQTFSGPARQIHHAELALLVTTSRFTGPAIRDAALLGVILVDRDLLAAWAADQTVPAIAGGISAATA